MFRKIKLLFNKRRSPVWDELKKNHISDQQIKEIKEFFNHRSSLYDKNGNLVEFQGEAPLITKLCSIARMGL